MSALDIERVWGMATVSGGGHVVKVEKGIIHMVACDLPSAAVRLTLRSSMGSSASAMLTLEQVQELIRDLKDVAYDG